MNESNTNNSHDQGTLENEGKMNEQQAAQATQDAGIDPEIAALMGFGGFVTSKK